MAFSKRTWDQLKSVTSKELISALTRDGWAREITRGATQAYYKEGRRVVIHNHPKKTYGPKTLKAILSDIGWNEDDLRRLKLIR